MKDLIAKLDSLIPDYADDIKTNLWSVMNSPGIDSEIDAPYIALASAVASGNNYVADIIAEFLPNEVDKKAAYIAASLSLQNSYWYSFIDSVEDSDLTDMPSNLETRGMLNFGGTELTKFNGYSLAASIIGKCTPCIKLHYMALKNWGYRVEQLRNIGRIAVVINAICKIVK